MTFDGVIKDFSRVESTLPAGLFGRRCRGGCRNQSQAMVKLVEPRVCRTPPARALTVPKPSLYIASRGALLCPAAPLLLK